MVGGEGRATSQVGSLHMASLVIGAICSSLGRSQGMHVLRGVVNVLAVWLWLEGGWVDEVEMQVALPVMR